MVIAWDRGKTKINRLLRIVPSKTRDMREWTCRVPYEIMEMVTAHLIDDLHALKAFSLTCRFCYLLAVPHHHTLTLRGETLDKTRNQLKPVSKLHGLGLAPLVKEIRVTRAHYVADCWFVPPAFSRRSLRHFSAPANVQALILQNVNISRFIPGIQSHFGHFSPTLRSIVLVEPRCTPRQLSYFLSHFSNLDDINIHHPLRPPHTITPDLELVPFSPPKLRGRLELFEFTWDETWKDLINLCGGLRFRYTDLRNFASYAPILLGACAETVETLRFYTIGKRSNMSFPLWI